MENRRGTGLQLAPIDPLIPSAYSHRAGFEKTRLSTAIGFNGGRVVDAVSVESLVPRLILPLSVSVRILFSFNVYPLEPTIFNNIP